MSLSSSIKRNSGADVISWDNITADDTKERNVEMYLWQVDIGLELTNPSYNPEAAKLVIKTAIFECMKKYKSNGCQARIFQLLQDIYLFTKGDITDEDLEVNFEHILDALKNAISFPDVASSALELLSMLATKTFIKRKYYDSDAFQSSVINLITSQSNNKVVVRAGMSFFVEICKTSVHGNNESDITTSFSFSVAEKILTCMLQNISIFPDDSLFFSCFRFIEEFLDKAPKTPNNHTNISKIHTNIIVDIILVAISSSEQNSEVLLLSFQCLNRLKLEPEHIDKINKGPGIIIYLVFMDNNPNLSDDVLCHLELIVQGLTHLDVYDSNTSMESITEFRDIFVNKIKELEGDFDSVEKIYNYYIEIMNILNKILPAHTEHNKESIDIITKLESARESPNKESEGLNFGTEHINSLLDDKDLIRKLQIEKAEMAEKIREMTGQLEREFSEMDALRKKNIEMYNKMFSAVSELTDTKKLLEGKQYEFDEGKRIIKDMITLTTLSQKQAVFAIEESDNLKILYKNVKEENELLRQMLEVEAQEMDFPHLANSEIIRYPDSPKNITSEKDETNDDENEKDEKAPFIPMEGMVSLTIVGIREALRDHDTLLKKYHKENNLDINLIRSDKGLTVPLVLEGNIASSTTTTLDTTIDTLAHITRLVYKSFKKASFCGNEKVNHTTMSTQTLRYSLKELGLITTASNSKLCTLTDLDMIIVRLGIFQKISIFGFIYVAIMLALKNESNNNRTDTNNEIVLQKVIDTFERYLNKKKDIDDINMSINISEDDTIKVNKLFDDEKLSLKHLFLSYLPNVPRIGYDESKELVPTTAEGGFGLSLEVIVQFCRDFNLTPAIVNTGTIIKIFENVLSTGFVSGHGEPLLNYLQFRTFLLHISIKCNYFEDYHGRDRIERRLYNLFYYLDHSSGFESISSRDRSITITRFKLIYAREDARINKELQVSMKKKNDFMKDNIALKRVKAYKPM